MRTPLVTHRGCYGSCAQGRAPCTMPGVCGTPLVTLDSDGEPVGMWQPELGRPWLLVVYAFGAAAAIAASALWPWGFA